MDLVRQGGIVAVPRVDFDRFDARGGYSPAYLNWDAEVRAEDAGIVTAEPPGRRFNLGPELVDQAAAWFGERRAETP
jgi:hypothetical protein